MFQLSIYDIICESVNQYNNSLGSRKKRENEIKKIHCYVFNKEIYQ